MAKSAKGKIRGEISDLPDPQPENLQPVLPRPDGGGLWFYRPNPSSPWRLNRVVASPASGIHCFALKMGGPKENGWSPFSGEWQKA